VKVVRFPPTLRGVSLAARSVPVFALVWLAACGDDPVTALFAVPGSSQGDDFYALPFPSDLRRDADGRLDLSELPTNSAIAETVRQIAEQDLDGFGLNAAIFARFSGPLDPDSLPSPAQSLEPGAAVYLVDVDPDSPTHGERWPVIASFREDGTQTMLGNRLVVRPYPGFPLADGTTYALVITRRLRAASGGDVEPSADFVALRAANGGDPVIASARTVHAPLLAYLDEPGGDERDTVVSAAVFTTQRATHVMPAIHKAVYGTPVPVARDITQTVMGSTFGIFTGLYDAPNLQSGEPPYISSGGRVTIGNNGAAVVQRTEELRFALAVPNGEVPATGFPICIYQHGTTGDWMTFFQDGTADRLTAEGIAVISTDQVLHGPRGAGADPSIAFFNFNNPVAGRDNPLQGAADAWSQQRLALGMSLTDGGGRTIRFDPERVYFFGHSQGGLTGPGYVAFEPALKGAVLSGTGGTFYLSLLDKKKPLDFYSLISTLIRDEPVDEDNPTIHMAQMAVERNDPVNYAPFMVRQLQRGPDGTMLAPRNIFHLEGFTDNYTPNRVIQAFAVALGADAVELPDAELHEGLALRGKMILTTPITNNAGSVTNVLAQYRAPGNNDGHFVAFDVAAARKQSAKFLGTLAATGRATVVSP
jgi:hypothetical protein